MSVSAAAQRARRICGSGVPAVELDTSRPPQDLCAAKTVAIEGATVVID